MSITNRTAPGSRAGTSAVPHRWLTGILVALMVLINVQTIPAPVSAQIVRQQCGRQGPADGSFVADVCFTTPTDGAILSGDVNINVSVTQVSGVMPKVELVRFYFARSTATTPPSLLTDYAEPWGLTLPTDHWKDTDAESKPVTYQIAARVKFANGYETIDPTTYARIFVDFENGRTSDEQNNGTWAPKTSGTSPLTVVATGDGAGGLPGATAVGNLVTGMNPDLFLYLGDVYNAGKYAEFYNYYEPTLGALKARTNPVPGNHEGGGDQFKGYLDYWDSTKHYYSYDSGGWHFIALDSTAEYGQLGPGSTQYEWLVQDLQANANTACTMVFFHHPRFGLVTNATDVTHRGNLQTIWSLLATSGVDVVLNGHEHNYQRWRPMDANGTVVADGSGPRQFIIGTAGHDLQGFGGTDSRIAARISGMDGALKLSLTPAGGSAQFVGTNGTVQDSSSFTCNGAQPPSGPITFGPDADALVQQALPDQNAGTSTSLRADKSPNEESYLRFNVQAGSQPITRATLRLWVRDGTADAPGVARSDSVTWSESGITWNTKPAYGPIGADVRQATTNTWLEYDVTSLVTGNGPVTFALVPQSTDGLTVDAKESGSNTPQLVLNGNPVPSQPPPAPAPTGDVEVKAAADARVQEANPTINYGTDPLLRADGGVDPDVETYLKFSVSGLSGAPTTAKIALFINEGGNAGSVDGPALYSAPSTWQETTITWNNRTTRGTTAFGDFGAVTAGSWVVYDVSSAITGNGEYTFVLATTSNDATDFDSRETANTPRLLLSGITSQPPPEPSTTALKPVADAMVQQGLPDTNAGTANSMRADTQPVEVSYLRFDIPADPGQITKAMLRLWVRDNTSGTIDAPAIATSNDVTWSETGITWNNRPAVGPPGPNAGAVGINTWIEYDVTSLVTGNGPVTLVLVPESTDGMIVNTRENTTNTPQLVISRGTGSGTPPATSDAATPPAPATPTATTPPSSAETRAFEPLADAMVLEAVPNENHGSDPVLHADQGPSEMSYLRFDVQTGGAAISKATLRLWVDSGTVDGPAVAGSSDVTWGEGTITWAARPTIGGAVADAGVVASGSWLEYNVTSLVTVDGLVTMVLVPQSTDGISMSSREAVTNHPQLVVTYSGIAGTSSASRSLAPAVATQPSATSTVAATPTATPQVTPTVAASTPSPTPTAIATEGNLPTATSTPAATPLPVVDGWQTDPAQPWTRLTDADPTSVWTAPLGLPPDRAEIGIDLGAVMALGHLRLLPAPPYQGMVTIELSADSVTWYHLTDVRLGEPGAPDEWVEVPAGYGARFARLVLTNPPAGGIAELELWAVPAGAVRPLEQLPPVVPTAASTEAPLPSDAPLPTAVPIVEPTPAPPTEAPVIPAPEPTAALTPEPTAAPPVEPTLEVPTDPATPSGGT